MNHPTLQLTAYGAVAKAGHPPATMQGLPCQNNYQCSMPYISPSPPAAACSIIDEDMQGSRSCHAPSLYPDSTLCLILPAGSCPKTMCPRSDPKTLCATAKPAQQICRPQVGAELIELLCRQFPLSFRPFQCRNGCWEGMPARTVSVTHACVHVIPGGATRC